MSLRQQLIHSLVKETEKTRRVDAIPGQDMTQGVTCPDCAPPKVVLAEAIGPPTKWRKVDLEYFKTEKWSVWVGRCEHCDMLIYAMRLDLDIDVAN